MKLADEALTLHQSRCLSLHILQFIFTSYMWSHLMCLTSIFPKKIHNLQFIFISSWCLTSYFNVKYQTACTILVFLSRWYQHFCNGRIQFMYLIKKCIFANTACRNFSQSLCLAGFCPCLSQSRDFWCPFWTILCPSEGFWTIFRSSEGSCPYPTQSRGCLSPFSACKQGLKYSQPASKV